tara:strand:+ start:189 stop:422 length:234 start_codon:yes stop_codon:yes gene_type:complete
MMKKKVKKAEEEKRLYYYDISLILQDDVFVVEAEDEADAERKAWDAFYDNEIMIEIMGVEKQHDCYQPQYDDDEEDE